MAKKNNKQDKKNSSEEIEMKKTPIAQEKALDKLPKDVQEKLKTIKTKLEKFQKKVLEKFDKYIVGIALLPPQKPEDQKQAADKSDNDKINVLVLVDDSDSRKMSKYDLKDKLTAIVNSIAQEIDKNLVPQAVILSELWQNCYDGKYELLQ